MIETIVERDLYEVALANLTRTGGRRSWSSRVGWGEYREACSMPFYQLSTELAAGISE